MTTIGEIFHAVRLNVELDLKRANALSGLAVFVLCTIFIVYLSVREPEPPTWTALYWLVFLFLSVHSNYRSFQRESARQFMYYYTLLSPITLFLSKSIYNALILFVLGSLMYGAMFVVIGSPVQNHGLFFLILLVGSLANALAFTFISAMAIKSDNSATLMTILSFPIIIPVFLNLIKMTRVTIEDPGVLDAANGFLIVLAIILILLGLAISLFPYLWKS